MVDFSVVTKAVEKILDEHTSGYTVERNAARNTDPNIASNGNGWVGIRKGPVEYQAATIGGSRPWAVSINTLVEVQCADYQSPEAAEDRLEAAVAEILGVLSRNEDGHRHLTLDGAVAMTIGYKVDYEINTEADGYFYAAIITIQSEARA